MTPVRLGVVGAGDVAQRDYLPEAHRLAGRAEITVLCGRDPERVGRVADQFGVPAWTTDYEEMLASDVDAVVNLTPVPAHEPITRAALRSGRHVYTEKPLASSSGLARELRAEADSRGLVLVCAPSVLLYPQLVRAREIVGSGELGTVWSARAQAFGGVPPWAGYDSDPSPYFSAGVGPLVDVGVYPLHALSGLLGPVRSVSAMARRTRARFTIAAGPRGGQVIPVEAEDDWQLILDLGTCLASVEANFATVDSAAADCELRGDQGAIAFSLLDVAAPVSVQQPGADGWSEFSAGAERSSGPDHILGVLHLAECIATGRPPLVSAAHAIHVLDVIEAARRSASLGQTVSVAAEGDMPVPFPAGAGELR
jgi:predicted dehydrogenase